MLVQLIQKKTARDQEAPTTLGGSTASLTTIIILFTIVQRRWISSTVHFMEINATSPEWIGPGVPLTKWSGTWGLQYCHISLVGILVVVLFVLIVCSPTWDVRPVGIDWNLLPSSRYIGIELQCFWSRIAQSVTCDPSLADERSQFFLITDSYTVHSPCVIMLAVHSACASQSGNITAPPCWWISVKVGK